MQAVGSSETGKSYSAYDINNNTSLSTFKNLIVASIDSDKPVMANGYGSINGYSVPDGHWLVVRGYDDNGNTFYVMDPAYGVLSNAQASIFSISASTLMDFIRYRGIVR